MRLFMDETENTPDNKKNAKYKPGNIPPEKDHDAGYDSDNTHRYRADSDGFVRHDNTPSNLFNLSAITFAGKLAVKCHQHSCSASQIDTLEKEEEGEYLILPLLCKLYIAILL